MKKSVMCFLLSTAAASLLPGCNGGGRPAKEPTDGAADFPPDTAFYGHLGEGTGMSSLELVTDGGDTLALNKTNEKTGATGRIVGEIANYTDRYAVTTCDEGRSVSVALNVSQIAQRKWQSDTDGENGFLLEADGKTSPLSGTSCKYARWKLHNCKLVLSREGGGASGNGSGDGNDTLEILKLTPDSLTLKHVRTNIPEKFHRMR